MIFDHLIGIGLRHPHYKEVLKEKIPIGWLEVHSENFFQADGSAIDLLCEISKTYPISLHGVGLSLGSADGVLEIHLKRLKNLIERVKPFLVSEHLSWGFVNGVYMHDLLPIPYTQESVDIFCKNVSLTQDYIGREILIENPSSYIEYKSTNLKEADFLNLICKNTGSKILLDVNNIFVSSSNHDWNAKKYIDSIECDYVKEIHLAGHSKKNISTNQFIRVDTHDQFVCPEVWELYKYAVEKFGPVPTLLEWDAEIPSLETLVAEAKKALEYFPIKETSYAVA